MMLPLAALLGPLNLGMPELLVIVAFLVMIPGTALWIWTIIDCATKEPESGNTKIVWILVIALAGFIGSLIYIIVRRPARKAAYGR
jgi:hypothetical protein